MCIHACIGETRQTTDLGALGGAQFWVLPHPEAVVCACKHQGGGDDNDVLRAFWVFVQVGGCGWNGWVGRVLWWWVGWMWMDE